MAKVPTITNSALCAGTAEELGVVKTSRIEHPRMNISEREMFANISHTRRENKRCPNSAAADDPLCISQTFPTYIANTGLGFEGFDVRCQSKQTSTSRKIIHCTFLLRKVKLAPRGEFETLQEIFSSDLVDECWPHHLLIKSLKLLASK